MHGHRNVEQVPIRVNENCFNLCEHIEYGGNLRCLELDSEGVHEVYTPNPVFRKRPEGSFATVGEMLDVLEKHGVVASFFLIGNNINDQSAEAVKRAYDMGCEIGNHSKSHEYMDKLTPEEIIAEFEYVQEKLLSGLK